MHVRHHNCEKDEHNQEEHLIHDYYLLYLQAV